MKQLLADYKRRLATLTEELNISIKEATDISKITRLTIKGGCYRTFIAEMERILPTDKPVDPKLIEAQRKKDEDARAERDRLEREKDEKFFKHLEEMDKEEKNPEGF